MRLFILDSGLVSRGSHNLVFALLVSEEARRRGIETAAFTHRDFPAQAGDPFTAIPTFTSSYYDKVGHDPVTSVARAFTQLNMKVRRELEAIPKSQFQPTDVIWLSTISERHLRGVLEWIATFPPETAPQFVITLVLPAGASVGRWSVTVYDTLIAYFYRIVLGPPQVFGPNVHLIATGIPLAADYSYLAMRTVTPHPLLVDVGPLIPPSGKTLLVYVGDAAPRKGIAHLPETVRQLARQLPDWRLLAHVNDQTPGSPAEPVAELRALAETVPQLDLRSGFLNPDDHRQLFEEASVVLLGYDAVAYKHGMSGVLWEAIAAARPMILPAGTYLEREANVWKAVYASIDTSGARRIVEGVVRLLQEDTFDRAACVQAARHFRSRNGVDKFVDYLTSVAEPQPGAKPQPLRTKSRRKPPGQISNL